MSNFTNIDAIAFIFFLVSFFGYGLLTQHGALKSKNISEGVHTQRKLWMNTMIERENRMIDMLILTNLSQGNAFFASTAMVIVGALAAALGSSTQFNTVLQHIPLTTQTEPYIFNTKLIFIIIIFLFAFFKFAWAYRITHYTSIMMGATPIKNDNNNEECLAHVERVANLAGLAGKHGNSGLHSYYYGIAACGWFINPYIFMAATTLIVLILYRREYHSKGYGIITNETSPLSKN